MYRIKLISYVVFFIVVALIGIWFASENSVSVSAYFFGFPLPPLSLGLLLMFFFLAGGLFGVGVSLIPYFSMKKQVLLQKRKLQGYEKEIAKLRTAPLRN